MITSEDAASILYYEGKHIPISERPRAIRNAVMTLKRMQNDRLIIGVVKDGKTRMRRFKVVSREELRIRISKELRELFGEHFLAWDNQDT